MKQDDGSEYCTCIYECGNGVWKNGGGKAEEEHVGLDNGNGDEGYQYRMGMQKAMKKGYVTGKRHGKWTWEVGCKKYCHAGVCDGQG